MIGLRVQCHSPSEEVEEEATGDEMEAKEFVVNISLIEVFEFVVHL